MRRRVPQAVSLCLIAGLIAPGAQGFPVYAAETEVVSEADGETVSETTVDTELTDASASESATETAGETAEASDEEASASAEETDGAETEEKDSVVGELIFAQCEDYINVRTMANTDSAITAKIYNNDSATVIAVTEDQEWYIVASGNACGYVKAEYFATGEEAEAIASKVAYNVARVYADELNVRSDASTDSEVIDVATAGDEIEVVLYGDDWMKVALGNDVYGYVNSDYVEYITYYPVGETLEEEAARLGLDVTSVETEADKDVEEETEASEEVYVEEDEAVYEETWAQTEAVQAETTVQTEAVQVETTVQTEAVQAETAAQTEAVQTEAAQTETSAQTEAAQTETTAQTDAAQTETTAQTEATQTEAAQTEATQTETAAQTEAAQTETTAETEAAQTETTTETEAAQTETSAQTEAATGASTEASTESSSSASTGESIANYALQFVGNPYVYGGTSLTSGADCSGFVQSVFAHFGIYLSRTAAAQSTNGTTISTSELQAGDLLFYSSTGSGIDHVAIYIGGGRIVHAANSTRGICTDSAYYTTPVCAVRCY